jgi:hypothetical protein
MYTTCPLIFYPQLIGNPLRSPYFNRFSRTPAGSGLAALQATRMASSSLDPESMSQRDVTESLQFLSTLFCVQGSEGIEPEDWKRLTERCNRWRVRWRNSLAAETAERCLGVLEPQRHMYAQLFYPRYEEAVFTLIIADAQGDVFDDSDDWEDSLSTACEMWCSRLRQDDRRGRRSSDAMRTVGSAHTVPWAPFTHGVAYIGASLLST